ncbi:MAG: hypothetical protein K8S54_09275 [Spirochaetia bacterium]|nr:hypothetical protein [Spirochaetia bacterium]
MKRVLLAMFLLTLVSCVGHSPGGSSSWLLLLALGGNSNSNGPSLNPLSISGSTPSSITLAAPTLSNSGSPAATLKAYVGLDSNLTVSGASLQNVVEGPVDVTTGGYAFTGLTMATVYRIVVVAENPSGYSVQQIVQSTGTLAPVLNNLTISSSTSSSITLTQPTFSTAGNPLPTVNAYIGVNGTISVTGSTVSNSTSGPFDVSAAGKVFSGLGANASYRIIVVASNIHGYSVQQIAQSTAGIAPVLNSIAISASDSGSISVSQPTFATAGNPAPTVRAYIGLNGTISVTGSNVSGEVEGPVNVASSGYQFSQPLHRF